ncbi:MAG TPA: hypothetical protein VHA71_06360 [Rhodanobacteraceae bacterium]|nr:hypothetical protein [Rhodanobacteraceae bacterium]
MDAARPPSSPNDVSARLHLAATPMFATMALLTAVTGHPVDMLCNGMHGMSLFGGMPLMYVLMAVVHAAPWFTRVSRAWAGLHNAVAGRRMKVRSPLDGSAYGNAQDGTDGLPAHWRRRPRRCSGRRIFSRQYFPD